jgi:thioredoxin reductase
MHDVIVIGGSYAGLSAALQLGRARRSVLVVDAGERRNRFASHAHGLLGRDGESPEAIAARGRADVLAYPTVALLESLATGARPIDGGFAVRAGDDEHLARRLVLATGVRDELPAVAGLRERWGASVFHCPYCHGYELDRGRLGVLASGPHALFQVALVAEWGAAGETTLFLDGKLDLDPEQRADLDRRRIRVELEPVAAIEDGSAASGVAVRLASGRLVPLAGLFVQPRTRPSSPLGEALGCQLDEGHLGPYYRTDATKETTVPGVFACGDAAVMAGTLPMALADGAMAGVAAHRSLVFRPAQG